jgi:hypothetical protein
VEIRVQVLLASVDDTPMGKLRSRDIHKLLNLLKLRKTPNKCLWYLPRNPLVYLTHLFNHSFRLSHFLKPWREAKCITLPKFDKVPKFPRNLHPINLLSTTGKLFEKRILKIVRRHIEGRGLLNASQFTFRARQSTTFRYMKLTDHVVLNLKNDMSTAAIFLDI